MEPKKTTKAERLQQLYEDAGQVWPTNIKKHLIDAGDIKYPILNIRAKLRRNETLTIAEQETWTANTRQEIKRIALRDQMTLHGKN